MFCMVVVVVVVLLLLPASRAASSSMSSGASSSLFDPPRGHLYVPATAGQVLSARLGALFPPSTLVVTETMMPCPCCSLHSFGLRVCQWERHCLPMKARSAFHCLGVNVTLTHLVAWLEDHLHVSSDASFRHWLSHSHSLFLGDVVPLDPSSPSMSRLWHAALESRPLLFEWSGLKNLDISALASLQSKERIWVKIAERSRQFEGSQRASDVPGNEEALVSIPPLVREALEPHLDVVVPRPHHWETTMDEFLTRIHGTKNATFYLEYYPSAALSPDLLPAVPDWKSIGNHLWLGANTTGRLHFDQYENINCVARGQKTFTIHHPHENENFYEHHLRQAMLEYDFTHDSFATIFDESTSLVMSPVDMSDPSVYEQYPLFRKARPWNVTVVAGTCLFLPSFWWHEVTSTTTSEDYVLAVNTWFEPVLVKEYPCPSCRVKPNLQVYHRQLRGLFEAKEEL